MNWTFVIFDYECVHIVNWNFTNLYISEIRSMYIFEIRVPISQRVHIVNMNFQDLLIANFKYVHFRNIFQKSGTYFDTCRIESHICLNEFHICLIPFSNIRCLLEI
jgi:hypothetical protein